MPVRLKQLAQDGATDRQVVTFDAASGEWAPSSPVTVSIPFGAKLDDPGKFAIANGKSSDKDVASDDKTRQPIGYGGTIARVAYKTEAADTTTQIKIHINGVVESTFTLANINANFGGAETVSVSVSSGDYAEIEFDAGTDPKESTWFLFLEIG